jgi:CRP-like cAMP-binding protein
MIRSPLLEGVSPQEYQTMHACLGVYEQSFRPDDVIYDFGDGRRMLGIVSQGSAVVERIDREGGRAILEHLGPGGVFGEMMMFKAAGDDSVVVRAAAPTRVSFLRSEAVMRRCEHACACHSRMVENLFRLVTEKATSLSERVEVLSRRSIREKLLRYFQLQAAKGHGPSFQLPFSLSALADYISADRSAMMRELKKMREEMLVTITGRQVTLS